jgi:hypothetical protein
MLVEKTSCPVLQPSLPVQDVLYRYGIRLHLLALPPIHRIIQSHPTQPQPHHQHQHPLLQRILLPLTPFHRTVRLSLPPIRPCHALPCPALPRHTTSDTPHHTTRHDTHATPRHPLPPPITGGRAYKLASLPPSAAAEG